MRAWFRPWSVLAGLTGLLAAANAFSAVPNALVMNEVNMVSGNNYLEQNKVDPKLGVLQGNGQNWWEFLVVQGDGAVGGPFKNTLDLRGWTIDWSYHKLPSTDDANGGIGQPDNLNNYGNGTITFSQDPFWAAVPRGTLLSVSEWQDAWYYNTDPDPPDVNNPVPPNGVKRAGGISGLGTLHGVPYDPNSQKKIGLASLGNAGPNPLFTNTTWNPGANGGGANGDWNLHVFAGERNPDTSFKYFSFTGSVTDGENTYAIGTEEAGLFAINNDLWRYSIKDAQGNVIQGPIGEWDPKSCDPAVSLTAPPSGGGVGPPRNASVSSTEIFRLEAFNQNTNPTQASYLGVGLSNYVDGSSSTFADCNAWSSGSIHQGVTGLRSWLLPGDANLDGAVNAADYVIWRKNQGGNGDWRQGDFNGDGAIDTTDYNMWRANFGLPSSGSGSGAGDLVSTGVPEPGSLVLLVFGSIPTGIAFRRRRK